MGDNFSFPDRPKAPVKQTASKVTESSVEKEITGVTFEEGKSSKKKWLIVGIVVFVLLVFGGGVYGYSIYSDVKDVEYFMLRTSLCSLECPFISEEIDYVNGEGNIDPEKTLEIYGGGDAKYLDSACRNLCLNLAQKDSGIEALQDRSEWGLILIKPFFKSRTQDLEFNGDHSQCFRKYEEEEITKCYLDFINKHYTEEEIEEIKPTMTSPNFQQSFIELSNLVCGVSELSFDYTFSPQRPEGFSGFDITYNIGGSSTTLNDYRDIQNGNSGSVTIDDASYAQSNSNPQNFSSGVGVSYLFIDERVPDKEIYGRKVEIACE